MFPENKYAEDLYFNIMYLLHCNSLIDIPDYKGYIRHVQEDSISRSWNLEDMGHILDVSKLIYSKISSYPNIDFSRLYKKEIGIIIYKLYSLHLLNNKKEAIEFLKKIHDFEKNISFTGTIDKIQNIANRLLLKKRYNLCYYYLKIIERTYSSNRLRKLYRKTN